MEGRAQRNTAPDTRYSGKNSKESTKTGKLVTVERQRDAAQYLADMILEMRNLAKSAQLHTVMVPLEYAYYEAFSVANKVEVAEAEIEHIRELSKASEDYNEIPESY